MTPIVQGILFVGGFIVLIWTIVAAAKEDEEIQDK
jgi:hypothetical protein